jgi:hypothetical protein
LRLHTFATVLCLTPVSTATGGPGRRPTAMPAPVSTAEQRRAVKVFELER